MVHKSLYDHKRVILKVKPPVLIWFGLFYSKSTLVGLFSAKASLQAMVSSNNKNHFVSNYF